MFGKKKKFEEDSETMTYLEPEPEESQKSLLDEWEEDQEAQAEKERKKGLFGKGRKIREMKEGKEKKEKKKKKEKAPLTSEQKKKRKKRIIIGGIVAALLAVTVLPRLFAPEILPVVTVFGINLAYVVSGSTLVETVFSWPGIGIMMFNAISNRDYNVLMGVYIILAVSVAAVMILVDLVYAKLDPRIHYE